jgi:hypothetical protein
MRRGQGTGAAAAHLHRFFFGARLGEEWVRALLELLPVFLLHNPFLVRVVVHTLVAWRWVLNARRNSRQTRF